MSSTFDTIANIIAETCDIPRDSITPDSHAINDLGIDSLISSISPLPSTRPSGSKLPRAVDAGSQRRQGELGWIATSSSSSVLTRLATLARIRR